MWIESVPWPVIIDFTADGDIGTSTCPSVSECREVQCADYFEVVVIDDIAEEKDEDCYDYLAANECDYFTNRDFWPDFLQDDLLDHAHLLNVFVTVLGEARCRDAALRYFMKDGPVTFIDEESTHGKDIQRCQSRESDLPSTTGSACSDEHEDDVHETRERDRDTVTVWGMREKTIITNSCITRLSSLRSCWRSAQLQGCLAVLTWRFPPVPTAEGDLESHYIVLVADPVERSVMSIDSRGVDFAKDFHPSWRRSLNELRERVFTDCEWLHYCYFDLQAMHPYDHFCQSWSLVFLRDYLEAHRLPCYHDPLMRGDKRHFDRIAALWRELILNVEDIREELYYQIYRMTHTLDGERFYDRYFSILEEMVTGGREILYPCHSLYRQTGYHFLEDFVNNYLTGELMHHILVSAE